MLWVASIHCKQLAICSAALRARIASVVATDSSVLKKDNQSQFAATTNIDLVIVRWALRRVLPHKHMCRWLLAEAYISIAMILSAAQAVWAVSKPLVSERESSHDTAIPWVRTLLMTYHKVGWEYSRLKPVQTLSETAISPIERLF